MKKLSMMTLLLGVLAGFSLPAYAGDMKHDSDSMKHEEMKKSGHMAKEEGKEKSGHMMKEGEKMKHEKKEETKKKGNSMGY